MQAKLTVIGGKANKREVLLNLPATIGRSREADLTVGHRMVSRKHCETYLVDGLMMIRDVGSLNGTYVHGKRIREAPLLPNEKFTIGPITFRVTYEYTGDREHLPPIIPAEPAEAADAPPAKPTQAISEPARAKTNSRPAAAKKAASKPASTAAAEEDDFQIVDPTDAKPVAAASKPDQEPDFRIVEDDDDDFELALQEDLGEKISPKPAAANKPKQKPAQNKPAAKKPAEKKPAKQEESEKDPEDQLLEDFLNDIQ